MRAKWSLHTHIELRVSVYLEVVEDLLEVGAATARVRGVIIEG